MSIIHLKLWRTAAAAALAAALALSGCGSSASTTTSAATGNTAAAYSTFSGSPSDTASEPDVAAPDGTDTAGGLTSPAGSAGSSDGASVSGSESAAKPSGQQQESKPDTDISQPSSAASSSAAGKGETAPAEKLDAALAKNEALGNCRYITVTTVTVGDNLGETSSRVELTVDVSGSGDSGLIAATGTATAYEKSIPMEVYFKDGMIYQKIGEVRHSEPIDFDFALRSVSASLWAPFPLYIDTISSSVLSDGKTRVLVGLNANESINSGYVESFINKEGYVDSQHLVTTVSETSNGVTKQTVTDKWITLAAYGDSVTVNIPDLAEYTQPAEG